MVTLGPVELTSRDIAALFWWGVIALALLIGRSTRSSLRGVRLALLGLLGVLLSYAAWVAVLALLATGVPFPPTGGSLWDIGQIKETVAWFAVAGLTGLFDFPSAVTEERFYLRRAVRTVWGAALLDFVLGLVTFHVLVEILLPIPLVLLTLFASPAVTKTEPGRRRAQRLRSAAGLLLLAGVAWLVATSWPQIDWPEQFRNWALTAWLTVGALPFIAWLSLFSTYQQALLHMRLGDGPRPPLKAKLALFTAFRGRARELHRFLHPWTRRLAEAPGYRAGLAVIRDFRSDVAQRDAAEHQKAADLVRYAGVKGVDAEGRQLDRREFEATRDALESMGAIQSGAYQAWGQYDRKAVKNLLPAFTRGLPDAHGITMKVRKDGQAWFAWRRTVTGWVFAVGATGPAPKQWLCDGPEPPKSYTGSDLCWPASPFEQGPNWET